MENIKTKPENKKGLNWNALFGFGAEIAKIVLVTRLTVYVSEKVKHAVNSRGSNADVIDFDSARTKVA